VEEPEAFHLDTPSDPFSLSIFNINTENNSIEVPVELNGIHLLVELDTDAGVSIISQRIMDIILQGLEHDAAIQDDIWSVICFLWGPGLLYG